MIISNLYRSTPPLAQCTRVRSRPILFFFSKPGKLNLKLVVTQFKFESSYLTFSNTQSIGAPNQWAGPLREAGSALRSVIYIRDNLDLGYRLFLC